MIKTHHFQVDDAVLYGVEKAVLLNNLKYWLDHAKANGKKAIDGYYWTFNSATAFAELIPYISPSKIGRLMRELESDGIVIVGNHNRAGYDRTKWYTMPEYALQAAPLVIVQNVTLHCPDLNNPLSRSEQPIPDINTDNKHHSKQVAAKAAKKLTKAELLVQKVRSEPNHYPLLNKLDDELLLEWAKLRTRKGASDSGRALNRIEKVLSTLSYTHAFEPDYAIGKQCDAGWTSIEVDYFVKGNSSTGQQVAVHQPQQSLDDVLNRAF
tara:strand:- start:2182 stop:2982 length:801 start_codon:yes stop_codon:yes gene_type:complete